MSEHSNPNPESLFRKGLNESEPKQLDVTEEQANFVELGLAAARGFTENFIERFRGETETSEDTITADEASASFFVHLSNHAPELEALMVPIFFSSKNREKVEAAAKEAAIRWASQEALRRNGRLVINTLDDTSEHVFLFEPYPNNEAEANEE
ncbi:MAG TPA: hypothetical protein VFZ58_04630 [Candidatus Saccharimonadales bacterium]